VERRPLIGGCADGTTIQRQVGTIEAAGPQAPARSRRNALQALQPKPAGPADSGQIRCFAGRTPLAGRLHQQHRIENAGCPATPTAAVR